MSAPKPQQITFVNNTVVIKLNATQKSINLPGVLTGGVQKTWNNGESYPGVNGTATTANVTPNTGNVTNYRVKESGSFPDGATISITGPEADVVTCVSGTGTTVLFVLVGR